MQLAATDIHGVDSPGAACEQTFSTSAGRGADIEADAAAGVEYGIGPEVVEGRREL
jgi:hypothetical protein